MDLRTYEQHKFALAEILRSASTAVPSEAREWHERAQQLFARLAEDRFNLVVVGRFNRGKTSLMNAILGSDRLPTGIVPLTSVVTTVTYGSYEQVVLHYHGRSLASEIAIEDLPPYVTQAGNPGNVRGIKHAEVRLPAEILRRGFHFVDTPGLGSAVAENTATTEGYLSEADAFLLVTSYESPLSDEEMRFLHGTSHLARRIFVVLNKHDTVTQDERRAVLAYVREQLASILGPQELKLFSVSAREGLEAKGDGNQARLDDSGLTAVESELIAFLLEEKSAEFLLAMCDRVAALVQEPPSSPRAPELEQMASAFRRQISDHPRPPARDPGAVRAPRATTEMTRVRQCEICAYVNRELWEFLCRFQYDLSISEEEQQRFAEAGGLCSVHTWQYEAIASPLGNCKSFPPLLDRVQERLRARARAQTPTSSSAGTADSSLFSHDGCAMCAIRERAEMEAVSRTARRLAEDQRRVETLSAICLPHLELLLGAVEDPGLVGRLLEREATIIGRLSEDMKRYALKRDAVRRHLLSEEETDAARQALLMLAGHRNVTSTPRTVPPPPAAARGEPAESVLGRSSGCPKDIVEVLEANPR